VITEWFLTLMADFVGMLADAFGPWTPPSELVNATSGANSALANMQGVGVWVNWPVLMGCIATSVAVWGGVLVIKLVRAIAAHVPQFGGGGD